MVGDKDISSFIGNWVNLDDDIPLYEYCIKSSDRFSIHDLTDGEDFKILSVEHKDNKVTVIYYVGSTNRTVEQVLELVNDNKIYIKSKYKFNGQYNNTMRLVSSKGWEGIWRCTDESIDDNVIKINRLEQKLLSINIQDNAYILIEGEIEEFVPSKQVISDIQFDDNTLSFSVDDNGILGYYNFQRMSEKTANANYFTKNYCFHDYLYRQGELK